MEPLKRAIVTRVRGGARETVNDELATEEPLEIRIAGDTFAVTMRTPGHDRELVLGLLFSEGVISSVDDVSGVAHCGRTGDEGRENTVEVTAAPGVVIELGEEKKRGTITSSACGVCGRQSIDDLLRRAKVVASTTTFSVDAIARGVRALGRAQPLFARTGGCHGALLVDASGEVVRGFEDVGRHNAVDKVIGAMLLQRALPLSDRMLVVSGRSSFEIVQKAALAGVPLVASVSAPSSLAVNLAERTGVTLAGFVREGGFNLYAHAERVID